MTSNTNVSTPPLFSAPIPISSTSSTKHHHHHHTRITSSSGSVDASPDLLSDSSTAVVGTPLLTSASLSTPRTIHSSHHSKTQLRESDSFSDEDFNNFELAAAASKTHKKRRHKDNETPPPVVAPISCSAPAGSAGSPMLLAAMSTPRKPTSREDFECIRFIGKGDVGRVYIFFFSQWPSYLKDIWLEKKEPTNFTR